MTQKEMLNRFEDICDYIEKQYGKPEMEDRFGRKWYRVKEGYHIHPELIRSMGGMVIEHAIAPDTVYVAEDGDVFYFEDYKTVEEMIIKIEKEIND